MLLAIGRKIRFCIMFSCLDYYNSKYSSETPVQMDQLLTTTLTTKRGILQQFTTYSSGFIDVGAKQIKPCNFFYYKALF